MPKQLISGLRFRDDNNQAFPDWEERKLGEVAEFFSGGTPSSTNINYYSGTIPFIKSGEINALSTNQFLSKEGMKNSSAKMIEKGDILFALYGATSGEVAIAKLSGAINQAVLCIRPNLNREFLFAFLSFSKSQILSKYLQGGQGNLSAQIIKSIKVPLPSLPEQRKIAAFLSAVDKRIGQQRKQVELLREYKKGVMQKIFSRQIRFKDEEGKDFPEWEERKLGEVAKKIREKNKKLEYTFVLTNSATKGIVSQQDYFDKDIANQENLEGYYIVKTNDFVYNPRISSSAPVGPIKRNNTKVGVMSPLYTVFRFTKGYLHFFELYFQTSLWHRYMNSVANFGARHDRMNITSTDFFNLPIPFPSLPEQRKIASFLSALDRKIDQAQAKLKGLEEFKKGLLQGMFV